MEMRVLLALALSFALGGLVQAAPLPENIDFKVYRDGDEIGHHRVTFSRDGEAIIADVDIELAVTFAGMEGYVNARICVEALRRALAAGAADARGVAAEMNSMGPVDLGGFVVNFSGPPASASDWVDIVVRSRTGHLLK